MKKAFTLIEILLVIFVVGIIFVIGFPKYSELTFNARDSANAAFIKNMTNIILSDEFTTGNNPNFSDLDEDGVFAGAVDPVSILDIKNRLFKQDYALKRINEGYCYLYGYESELGEHDDAFFITEKARNNGFIYDGTINSVIEAQNITAISCAPGAEGVTGGDWTNYQWLNLIP